VVSGALRPSSLMERSAADGRLINARNLTASGLSGASGGAIIGASVGGFVGGVIGASIGAVTGLAVGARKR